MAIDKTFPRKYLTAAFDPANVKAVTEAYTELEARSVDG